MAAILKADLINGAFSRARVSGLTVVPGAEDLSLALDLLESLMAEWEGRGYCIGYKLADPEYPPDTGDPSGISRNHKYAVECALAVRIMDDYGKPVPPGLQRNHSASFSALAASIAVQQQTEYPNRMPRGSGTDLRYNRWQRYFRKRQDAPISCETNYLFVGEIDSYQEDYTAWLNDGEIVDTTTLEAEDGITVTASGINTAGNILSYTVEATGTGDQLSPWARLKITAQTDAGRTDIRFINFQLDGTDI